MATQQELEELLAYPNETLSREYKSWLNLDVSEGKATLAKAAIALANHGGGTIVLGMAADEHQTLASQPRANHIPRYDQDQINAAINRFCDPEFHSELLFVVHPGTGVEHAIVLVPSVATPVMSTRAVEGVIAQRRCYVRKPGPKSEEALTGEEWRLLLDRCVRDARENLLDAIRAIVQGRVGGVPDQAARDALSAFADTALERWEHLVRDLPTGDAARMPRGRYELSFEIRGIAPAPTLAELRRRLGVAHQVRLTGWGPFIEINRPPVQPYPLDDMIEAWLGAREPSDQFRDRHSDFWRVHRTGRLFLLRSFDEDASERIEPGVGFDFVLPVWRVGEALLFVSRLARQFREDPQIAISVRYRGLRGRRLVRLGDDRWIRDGWVSQTDSVVLQAQATASEIDDNLAEVLHPLLAPLYEQFSFFELPMQLVTEELAQMRANRF